MRPPRAVLTGASGFTGRALAAALGVQGWPVGALRLGLPPKPARGDAPAPLFAENRGGAVPPLWPDPTAALAEPGPLVIFHLGAPGGAAGADELAEWIAASLRLIAAAADRPDTRFVLAGSWWQHDSGGAVAPCAPYAAAKQAVQTLLDHYAAHAGLSACTAILFDSYGPADPRPKLLPALIAADGPFEAGDPARRIDLVHVADLAAGLIACALARESGGGGLYTLGGEQRLRLDQLADLVGRLRGRPLAMRWHRRPPGPGPAEPRPADRPPPGWHPSIPLEDGLRQVIEHG